MKLHWPDLPHWLHLKKKNTASVPRGQRTNANPTLTRTARTRAALLGGLGGDSQTPSRIKTQPGMTTPSSGQSHEPARGVLHNITGTATNPGNLRFYEFIPANLKPNAPLVVLLHGCQQNARVFLKGSGWETLAREHGFALLLGEQRMGNNPTRCFNWFQPGDTSTDGGEAHSIHAMTVHMIDAHELDPAKSFITGLSAGGAMTAAMLASFPQSYRAGAVLSGLPFGAATSMTQAFSAMMNPTDRPASYWADLVRDASPNSGPGHSATTNWPRMTIWHGAKDRTVAKGNAAALERQWCALHGADPNAAEEITLPGLIHRKCLGASGETVVESILVSGMDHGVAIDADGKNGQAVGEAGPFFLDIGLSSTLLIARSWDLV